MPTDEHPTPWKRRTPFIVDANGEWVTTIISKDTATRVILAENAEAVNAERMELWGEMRQVVRLASRFANLEDGGPSALSIQTMAHYCLARIDAIENPETKEENDGE